MNQLRIKLLSQNQRFQASDRRYFEIHWQDDELDGVEEDTSGWKVRSCSLKVGWSYQKGENSWKSWKNFNIFNFCFDFLSLSIASTSIFSYYFTIVEKLFILALIITLTTYTLNKPSKPLIFLMSCCNISIVAILKFYSCIKISFIMHVFSCIKILFCFRVCIVVYQ